MRQSPQLWRIGGAGIRLLVRVTPKSSRQGIDGIADTPQGPALAVRVGAAPEKGEANKAIEHAIADWLAVSKGCVSVQAGGKSRVKTIEVAGEPSRLVSLIEARLTRLR